VTTQGNLWLAGTIIAAPCIGSWLGVVIERWPSGDTWGRGRSRCAACGAALKVADLVPIVSFILLRGRCRHCGAAIPRRLLMIETMLLAMAITAAVADPAGPRVAVDTALGAALLALAWIDALTMRLPDAITLPLLLAGLLDCALSNQAALTAHAAAVALGYLGLRGLALAYRGARGIEGIGAGDAKLLAAGGAWLGPTPMPAVLILAGLAGMCWFGILAARGQAVARRRIPFGPALALAIWVLRLRQNT
jgi:leader peptidase (prepilin peptidase)/N-methyltransferase